MLSTLAHPSGYNNDALWLPNVYKKTAIWLRGDKLNPTVAPSITSPLDLSTADWNKGTLTSDTTGFADPDGGTNAAKIVESGATSGHWIYQSPVDVVPGVTTTSTVWMKKIDRDWGVIYVPGARAFFNLATGELGTAVSCNSTIVASGSGYLCSMSWASGASTGSWAYGISNANGTFSYAGDGTSAMYLYNPTVTQSGITYPYVSSNFTTWTATHCSCAATGGFAPSGEAEYLFTDDSTATTTHAFSKVVTNASTGVSTTYSILARTNGRDMLIRDGSGGEYCYFDLTAGTLGANTTDAESITAMGSGWYLCSVTVNSNVATGMYVYGVASGTITYSGDGTSGIYLASPTYVQAGVVSTWTNHGNDTTLLSNVSQSTFAKMPQVTTMNSKQSMLCSYSADTNMIGTAGGNIPQPFTVFFVTGYTNGSGFNRRLMATGASHVGFSYTLSDSGISLNGFGTTRTGLWTIADGNHVQTVSVNGASSSAWLDGVATTVGDPGAGDLCATSDVISLFDNGVGGSAWNDKFSEIIIYTGDADADGVREDIERYLMARYGI